MLTLKHFKNTPTCFDLNRSSSGNSSVPRLSHWILKNHWI